jgi:hypothetical protein
VIFLPPPSVGKAHLAMGPVATNLSIYSAAIGRNGDVLGPAVLVAELSYPSPFSTAHPSLRRDGREVFFYSTRPGGLGSQDVWTSTRPNIHSAWSPPVNLGAPINTAGIDIHPTLTFDGLTLFWSSNRPGTIGVRDLWMSTRTRCGDEIGSGRDENDDGVDDHPKGNANDNYEGG